MTKRQRLHLTLSAALIVGAYAHSLLIELEQHERDDHEPPAEPLVDVSAN